MEYVILYHNGGKKWIAKAQALSISQAMDNPVNKFIDIGEGTKISISSISQILSKQEYKEQYPEKGTGQIFKDNFKQLPEMIDYKYETIDQQAMRSKKGREQLLGGLQRYIDENPDACENAKILLKEKMIKFGLPEKV